MNKLVDESGEWHVSNLINWVPLEIIDKIKALPPPHTDNGLDMCRWHVNHGHDFSIAFSYNAISGCVGIEQPRVW